MEDAALKVDISAAPWFAVLMPQTPKSRTIVVKAKGTESSQLSSSEPIRSINER